MQAGVSHAMPSVLVTHRAGSAQCVAIGLPESHLSLVPESPDIDGPFGGLQRSMALAPDLTFML
jgi:hypothetical protein